MERLDNTKKLLEQNFFEAVQVTFLLAVSVELFRVFRSALFAKNN